MRVYFGVCGIGLGHVGRSATLAKQFQKKGDKVLFSTYLDAIDYVKNEGFSLARAPALNYVIKPNGSIDLKRSSVYPGAFSVFIFLNQIRSEMQFMKAFDPDVVVSDTRGSSIVAAKTLGIPEVTILNQYKVNIPRTKRFLRLARIGDAYVLGLVGGLWAIGDRVIIPDFPKPHTISVENLRIPPVMERKVTYIGPIMDVNPAELPKKESLRGKLSLDNRPLIFAPISGSAMEKAHFIEILQKILMSFPKEYQIVMSLGDPNSKIENWKNGNLHIYSWLTNRYEFLKTCDLIISRSGHGTIMQSITYGKPMILIPTPNHTEQNNNAKRAEKLGVARVLSQKDLTHKRLLSFVNEAFTSKSLNDSVKYIQGEVEDYNGIDAALDIITEVAAS